MIGLFVQLSEFAVCYNIIKTEYGNDTMNQNWEKTLQAVVNIITGMGYR